MALRPAVAEIAAGAAAVLAEDVVAATALDELVDLVEQTDVARRSIGVAHLGPSEQERGAVQKRRSLYFSADIKAGETLTPDNVRSIRPGLGLPPKHYEALLGRIAAADIERGTPTSWDLVHED